MLGHEAVRNAWLGGLVVVDLICVDLTLDQVEPVAVTFLYLGCCECGVDVSVSCNGYEVVAASDLVVLFFLSAWL